METHVFIDFDGTIAPVDTTDLILERFADPAWQEVEEEWKSGRIGSRECLARQIAMVRATPAEIDATIAGIAIDADFPEFVHLCRRHGAAMTVVSDGLDRSVSGVLAANGLDLSYRANRLAWLGGDRWRLEFPHARDDCTSLSGNCKCSFTREPGTLARIVVGDGRSDFCIAARADLVLAKGKLAEHCLLKGLPHQPIAGFAEANELLEHWLASDRRTQPRQPRA